MRILFVAALLLAIEANAWVADYAPAIDMSPAEVEALPARSITNFVKEVFEEDIRGNFTEDDATTPPDFFFEYTEGWSLDLNGDGIKDFVFSVPWSCLGIWGAGCNMHFIVSDGANGRVENCITSFYFDKSDLAKIRGKTYFCQSYFWGFEFEKSKHNHWISQLYSFDTNGTMRCANAELGLPSPAVTIYYYDPKFKQVKLTAADLKKIASRTGPSARKYTSRKCGDTPRKCQ